MKSLFAIVSSILLTTAGSSAQWTYEALYHYQRPGAVPSAPLVVHSDGQIYGTAVAGGVLGGGTVFRLADGAVTTVANLGGATGSSPLAGLASGSDGNLYGTCTSGGTGNFGTIFHVSPGGTLTKLKDFTGTSGITPGSVPGELFRHTDGNFYGTARAGGSSGHGVVFRLSPGGVYTVMTQFTGVGGAVPGSNPVGRLVAAGSNLYGVTRFGGAGNLGTVFRISMNSGFAFTSIFAFTGTAGSRPGEQPAGGLVLHSGGNLYGTTERGGTSGFGTTFRLTTANGYLLLHQFEDVTASQPVGQLVEGADGKLYGACAAGGGAGFGGVFRISTSGAHELLSHFTGANGAAPQAGLVRLASNEMLGATSAGGPGQLGTIYKVSGSGGVSTAAVLSPAQGWHPSGAPAQLPDGKWIFPVAFGGMGGGGTLSTWHESSPASPVPIPIPESIGQQPDGGLLNYNGSWWGVTSTGGGFNRGSSYSFTPATGIQLGSAHTAVAGSRAEGPLTQGSDGLLYGLAREGGTDDRGTLFRLNTSGVRTAMFSFTGVSNSYRGRSPRGPLARASNGSLYGVTELGGSQNLGVIFKFTPPSNYQVLADFDGSGANSPRGGLITAPNGFIYGTTSRGGTNNTGTVIRINPSNDSWSALASFPATNGGPEGEIVMGSDGAILGFTTTGSSWGAVFRFLPANNSISFPVTFTGSGGAFPGAALSGNSSGIKFTGGLRELSPGQWLGLASGGGSGNGGVIFRLNNTSNLSFNDWATNKLIGLDASWNGDPDLDGIANAVEYALGSEPATPSYVPSPKVTGGHLQIMVPRIPTRNDIDYFIESSTTLKGAWTTIASSIAGAPFTGSGYVSGETAGGGNKSVTIRMPSPTTTTPAGFLRIRVEP